MVKVRVRIDAVLYVDYLSFHRIKGTWIVAGQVVSRRAAVRGPDKLNAAVRRFLARYSAQLSVDAIER